MDLALGALHVVAAELLLDDHRAGRALLQLVLADSVSVGTQRLVHIPWTSAIHLLLEALPLPLPTLPLIRSAASQVNLLCGGCMQFLQFIPHFPFLLLLLNAAPTFRNISSCRIHCIWSYKWGIPPPRGREWVQNSREWDRLAWCPCRHRQCCPWAHAAEAPIWLRPATWGGKADPRRLAANDVIWWMLPIRLHTMMCLIAMGRLQSSFRQIKFRSRDCTLLATWRKTNWPDVLLF